VGRLAGSSSPVLPSYVFRANNGLLYIPPAGTKAYCLSSLQSRLAV